MPWDVRAVQTAIYNVLNDANATAATYDLSTDLTDRVQTVEMGRPVNRPISKVQMGIVLVYAMDDVEEVAQMGATAPREITAHYGIMGAVQTKPFQVAGQKNHDVAEEQMILLGRNIKAVLRNDITLSNTVSWSVVTDTQYNADVPGFEVGTYVSPVVVTLETHKLST